MRRCRVVRDPRPCHQADQHGDLQKIRCCHDASAQPRTDVVDDTKANQDDSRYPELPVRREAEEGYQIWYPAYRKHGRQAGIHYSSRHPSKQEGDAATVALAEIDVLTACER